MQDLAELHRSSRPAMFLSDLGKPKASSPKNQVTKQQVDLLALVLIIWWVKSVLLFLMSH